jgi:hypothetical protein
VNARAVWLSAVCLAVLGTSASAQVGRVPMSEIGGNGLRIAGQYWADEVNKGNSGAALAINWNDGIQQRVTLTANVTITLSNPHAGGRYLLVLTQGSGAPYTVSWPMAVQWAGGMAPTLSTAQNDIDICTLAYTDAGGGIYTAACNVGY